VAVVEAVPPQISALWLIPALEAMVAQFPFRIRCFHSGNGGEFINHQVARMLNKLLIEQTNRGPGAATTTVRWRAKTER
jgi:hypothetical protein